MTTNRELEATWKYHDGTKHSLWSVQNEAHFLDFDNQPVPFKIYTGLEPIPLPREFPPSEVPALDAVSSPRIGPGAACAPDLGTLASILHHSAGITRRRKYPGGEMLFRAAACTGALYHIELYLVCGDLPGLPAGVYHFGAHDFALRRLREGDYRGNLARASGGEPTVVDAPAVIVFTGTYWRNSWKYRARAYRHCFWDSGTILANMLAVCAARRVPARVIGGFVDEPVNGLLDLDTQREATLCLVSLGQGKEPGGPASSEVLPLGLKTAPLSREEVDYPAIGAMHAASVLETEEEAAAWRGEAPEMALPEPTGRLFHLRPGDADELSPESIATVPIETVIARRGSTRQFIHRSITFSQLSTMLVRATRGVSADFLEPGGAVLNDLYLIVHAVDDLPAGSYVYHRDRGALELLEEGQFRRVAGYLGLQQSLPADASVDVFFLADLNAILDRFGNRGYRAAQLEAGIVGGKLYLTAYAQGLGATGLTFFDDDVTTFFSPHADGKSVMFLVALGASLRKRVVRP